MVLLKRMALAVVLSCFSEGAIAQQAAAPTAPDPSHTEAWWNSKYGEADTLGAVNNLSPSIVKDAAKLIKTGKVQMVINPVAIR
jgi:hypothetical protein